MSNNPGRPSQPIPLELPDGLEPEYANLARISHTPAEFILDFALLLPGGGHPSVVSRLLMSPVGAKLFHRALGENIARYESVFGEINTPGGNHSLAEDLFRPGPPAPPPPAPPDPDSSRG